MFILQKKEDLTTKVVTVDTVYMKIKALKISRLVPSCRHIALCAVNQTFNFPRDFSAMWQTELLSKSEAY